MSEPVTTTTDQDDVVMRFLRACEERADLFNTRVPFSLKTAKLVLSWQRGLVGVLKDDGTLERR